MCSLKFARCFLWLFWSEFLSLWRAHKGMGLRPGKFIRVHQRGQTKVSDASRLTISNRNHLSQTEPDTREELSQEQLARTVWETFLYCWNIPPTTLKQETIKICILRGRNSATPRSKSGFFKCELCCWRLVGKMKYKWNYSEIQMQYISLTYHFTQRIHVVLNKMFTSNSQAHVVSKWT